MTEVWKWVPGYEGLYEVSNLGNVRSLRTERIMKQDINSRGYARVYLTDAKGVPGKRFVHRIVANAFLHKPEGCDVVNHKDFDILNNRADNLEWVTQKANMEYSAERGRFRKTPEWRARIKSSVLARSAKAVVGRNIETGEQVSFESIKATKSAGFLPQNVSACCSGQRHTHRGYTWEYADMNKRTKALAIPRAVKDRVWERDEHCCVYCGRPGAAPNAHYIARSQGGLGIEQNILTLCPDCQRRYDQSSDRAEMRNFFTGYLISKYPDWDTDKLIYRRD